METTTTTRRLVNAEAGRVRTTDNHGHEVAPHFVNITRGDGAWGNPADAIAYAGRQAAARHQDMAVRIVDVETGEEWFVGIPARFTVENYNGLRDRFAVRDTAAPFSYYGPYEDRAAAEVDASWDNYRAATGLL